MSLSEYLTDQIGLTRVQRAEVLSRARRASMKDLSQSLRGIGLFILSIWAGFVVFAIVKVIFKIAGTGLSPIWTSAIAGGLGAIMPSLFMQHRLPRFVYAELRARGHDVCRACGYLRRGLAEETACPECGVTVEGAAGGGE